MRAIVTQKGEQLALADVEKPVPAPDQILVRVMAAASNISDNYKLVNLKTPGLIAGADFAGYVDKIGSEVTQGACTLGMRVAGFLDDMSKNMGGTFAEYCIAYPESVVAIPENISFEQATTIGLSGFTAAQALFQRKRRPTPMEPLAEEEPILVWGAATVLGMFVVQLAKLSGYKVIATASPANFGLIKSLGASSVYDYHEPNISNRIRRETASKISFAVDCISDGTKGTPQLVTESMATAGGMVSTVLPLDAEALQLRKDMELNMVFVYTLLGQPLSYPVESAAREDHRRDGIFYAQMLSDLLRDGRLKTPPIRLLPNGLASVSNGLAELVAGRVKAEKLVYRINDTPSSEEIVASNEQQAEYTIR